MLHVYELVAMVSASLFKSYFSGMLRPSTMSEEISVYPKVLRVVDILSEFFQSDDLKAPSLVLLPGIQIII